MEGKSLGGKSHYEDIITERKDEDVQQMGHEWLNAKEFFSTGIQSLDKQRGTRIAGNGHFI